MGGCIPLNLPTRLRSWNKLRKLSKESGIFVTINLAETKGGMAWHNIPLNTLLPRSFRLRACERIISYFKGGKHLYKRRSSYCVYARKKLEFIKQSPHDFYWSKVHDMYCMMYVAITRRGSGGRSPQDVGIISQISASPYLKVLPTPLMSWKVYHD